MHVISFIFIISTWIPSINAETTMDSLNTQLIDFGVQILALQTIIGELDGKIMIIGLSYTNSMTFFHHIEEMEGVDYRYMKFFTGLVTDATGKTFEDTFSMLVRDVENGVITEVNPMGELMEKMGVISMHQIGAADVKLMNANHVYDFTAREMQRDPKLLYKIEGE